MWYAMLRAATGKVPMPSGCGDGTLANGELDPPRAVAAPPALLGRGEERLVPHADTTCNARSSGAARASRVSNDTICMGWRQEQKHTHTHRHTHTHTDTHTHTVCDMRKHTAWSLHLQAAAASASSESVCTHTPVAQELYALVSYPDLPPRLYSTGKMPWQVRGFGGASAGAITVTADSALPSSCRGC